MVTQSGAFGTRFVDFNAGANAYTWTVAGAYSLSIVGSTTTTHGDINNSSSNPQIMSFPAPV